MIKHLPPEQKIKIDHELVLLINEADSVLLFLSGVLSTLEKESPILNYLKVFEAINSFQIDGDQISINSYFEDDPATSKKIIAYSESLELSLKLLKDVPRASHIIKTIHKKICESKPQEGIDGEFRTEQTFVGSYSDSINNADYIPPSPENISSLMAELDQYISSDISYPAVVNAALIHAQFEMIHPFNSFNGIVGRILLQLHFAWKKKLTPPVLLISHSLKGRRNEYFDRLGDIEKNGNWNGWIKFFLRTLIDSINKTIELINKYLTIERHQYETIKDLASPASIKLYEYFLNNPVAGATNITDTLGISKQMASLLISKFLDLEIISEISGKQRNRIYQNNNIISLFRN